MTYLKSQSLPLVTRWEQISIILNWGSCTTAASEEQVLFVVNKSDLLSFTSPQILHCSNIQRKGFYRASSYHLWKQAWFLSPQERKNKHEFAATTGSGCKVNSLTRSSPQGSLKYSMTSYIQMHLPKDQSTIFFHLIEGTEWLLTVCNYSPFASTTCRKKFSLRFFLMQWLSVPPELYFGQRCPHCFSVRKNILFTPH